MASSETMKMSPPRSREGVHQGGNAGGHLPSDICQPESVVCAAREDAAAKVAWRNGERQAAVACLRRAERYAAASQDPDLLLRQMIRSEAVSPLKERHKAIAAMAPSRKVADLIEELARDFLDEAREATRSSMSSSTPQVVLAEKWTATWIGTARQHARVLLGAAIAPALVLSLNRIFSGPGDAPPGDDVGIVFQFRNWIEGLIGGAVGAFHLLKAIIYDPISRTIDALAWALLKINAFEILSAGAKTITGFTIAAVFVLAAACGIARIVLLHTGPAHRHPKDKLLFSGRQLWYGFHRRLLLPPIASACGALISDLAGPAFALPFDFAATLGLASVLALFVPGVRARLTLTERAGEARQARIEVLEGVVRVRHAAFAVHELRAAELGPTPWWSPTQDVVLRLVDGREYVLEGFAGPRGAIEIVIEINRLIRNVPPLPYGNPPLHSDH
jgi:hypothetical protein